MGLDDFLRAFVVYLVHFNEQPKLRFSQVSVRQGVSVLLSKTFVEPSTPGAAKFLVRRNAE